MSSYALLSTELPFYKKHPKLTGAALGVTGSVVLALVAAISVLAGFVVAVGVLAGSVVLATVAAVGVLIATVFASGGIVAGKPVFCSSREIRC